MTNPDLSELQRQLQAQRDEIAELRKLVVPLPDRIFALERKASVTGLRLRAIAAQGSERR